MSRWFTPFPRLYEWKLIFNPKYWILMCLVIGPLMLILSGVSHVKYNKEMKNIDSEMYGEVVSVEIIENSLDVKDRTYVATVEPTDWRVFNSTALKSGETEYAYEKGEIVEIYYNASNTSEYFIEHNAPTNGTLPFIVFGSVFTLVGIGIWVGTKTLKN